MGEPLNQISAADKGNIQFDVRRAWTVMRAWILAHAAEIGCGLALTLMAVQMLVVISRKSITVDEIVMIPSGYYHVAAGNAELVHEHPPFSKIIAALPLLFLQPAEILPEQIKAAPGSGEEKWAYEERFWENNPDKFLSLSFWPRVCMIGLAVASGLLIFRFARDLFGRLAAMLAVTLFALEPTVLAHGRVVQTDMPAAFGFLLFFFMLRRYVLERSVKRAAWLGFAGALAVLTKFSMLLVGPVIAMYFAFEISQAVKQGKSWTRGSARLAIVAFVSLVTINAAYFFQHRPLASGDVQWIQETFPKGSGTLTLLTGLLSHVVPVDFVLGILHQIWHNAQGHPAGFLGMYSRTGWWYYFPVAFTLKTTIPFLTLSLVAVAWGTFRVRTNRDRSYLWMLVPFWVYTVFVLFSHIDIGVRYYLPAYTFLFIMGGALLAHLLKSRRLARVGLFVAIALMSWIGIEAVRAFPNHMSYMNQLASRHPHWWYLSDSNVEWGDDISTLAAYLRARGETRVRAHFLGDFIILHHYGVQPLIEAGESHEQTRYVAIGASYLNGSTVPPFSTSEGRPATESERVNRFAKYRYRTPEAVFGGSIYLFREDDH
ncbi:MAG: ArnT family glycosyltransferase [Pyrinomonadaceae bacterium]